MNSSAGGTVRSVVHGHFDALSAGEKKVGRALLANYPAAGLGTAAELAASAGVSAPTVVRFGERLGFGGHLGLQRALRAELDNEYGSPLRQYRDKSGPDASGEGRGPDPDAMQASVTAVVTGTYGEMPSAEFERAVELVSDPARPLHAIGGRFTRVAAEYLCSHLAMLRPGVGELRLGEIGSRARLVDLTRQHVLVVFDVRRHTTQLEAVAQLAARRHAPIILVTDRSLSPIAKVATVVLPVLVETRSPFDSIMGVMAVTEALIAAASRTLGDAGAQRLARYEEFDPDA